MTTDRHNSETLVAGYERAKTLFEGVFDTNKLALNTTLVPYWLGDDCFWYRRKTWQGSEFRLVDAKAGNNNLAFDHQVLASALENLVEQTINADSLPITKVTISLRPLLVRFEAFDQQVIYDAEKQRCTFTESVNRAPDSAASATLNTEIFQVPDKPMSGEKFTSPDGKKAAFVRHYNLWLEDLESGEERALTQDGEALFAYATTPIAMGCAANAEVQALWSPDSKRLLTVQTDNRQVKTTPIVNHVPSDGSIRPTVTSYRHAVPGDEHTEAHRFIVIEVDNSKIQAANYQYVPVTSHGSHGLFIDNLIWWSADSRLAYFVDMERNGKLARVIELDTHTGTTRSLFEERSETYIKLSGYFPRATLLHLPETQELVWYSERSGWGHLYLYDLNTGNLKHPITQGEWLVRSIFYFDAKRRECWIQTAGRVENRDPYYQDICRVNIDTRELTTVVSSDEEYTVIAPGALAHYMTRYYDSDRFINANAISPNAEYVITTRSRADQIPVSVLLNRNGETLLELETADISGLPEGWQWPESVKVLAADGKTEVFGTIFRPADFSPDKHYPVIDFSPYGSDISNAPKGAFRNNVDGGFFYPHAAALAELGFIVIAIDGRGSPGREKAFTHANNGSWNSSNFTEDRIAGIQQLADKYPYMDLNRVGLLALLSDGCELMEYPEFYKVGVYSNGIYDSRFLGALFVERYEGCDLAMVDHIPAEQRVKDLQGKMLLIHCLQNTMLAPAATLRVVDALQKANKDFDLLIFPGTLPERYAFRRTLDYFVTHLQGIEPPKEFCL